MVRVKVCFASLMPHELLQPCKSSRWKFISLRLLAWIYMCLRCQMGTAYGFRSKRPPTTLHRLT